MAERFKLVISFLIFASIFGCGYIKKKHNEQLQELLKESQEIKRKNDSLYRKELQDSIKKNLDRELKSLDSHKVKSDSVLKQLQNMKKKSK